MISTLVRGSLPSQPAPSNSEHKRGVFVYVKEKEVQISSKEKELLKFIKPNELVLRMLTGQIDSWLSHLMEEQSNDKPVQMSINKDINPRKIVQGDMGPPRPVKMPHSCRS